MTKKPDRRSIRLKGYDYSQPGAYFVTICTKDRLPLFEHDAIRSIAASCLHQIPYHFLNVTLDQWVIMPNHLHVILMIHPPRRRGVQLNDPTTSMDQNSPDKQTEDSSTKRKRFSEISPRRGSLSVIV